MPKASRRRLQEARRRLYEKWQELEEAAQMMQGLAAKRRHHEDRFRPAWPPRPRSCFEGAEVATLGAMLGARRELAAEVATLATEPPEHLCEQAADVATELGGPVDLPRPRVSFQEREAPPLA